MDEAGFAGLGEAGQQKALPLAQRLRAAGIAAGAGTPGKSLKAQLRAANDNGARFALILGDDEIAAGVVKAKDLLEHTETPVPDAELLSYLLGRLG